MFYTSNEINTCLKDTSDTKDSGRPRCVLNNSQQNLFKNPKRARLRKDITYQNMSVAG